MSISIEEMAVFCKKKGFIYGPEPEIYGGVAGFHSYGPVGKILKNNVEAAIRRIFQRYDFWEVECPTVLPKVVWEASGHLGGFSDYMVKCKKCKSFFRVDKLIEEHGGDVGKEDYFKFIQKNKLKCSNCGSDFNEKLVSHDLMMKTTIGVDQEAYNRPETATTTYLPFLNYYLFFRDKIPFGVFQIGKAYRNEISPRQSVIRGREFTQAEGQLFIFKDQKEKFERFKQVEKKVLPMIPAKGKKLVKVSLKDALKKGFLKNKAYAWTLGIAYDLFAEMGIADDKLRFRQHRKDEMAFYADDAWDLEVNLQSAGWVECCGVHDRTDYDLKQHEKFSKTKLHAINEGKKEHPHILEIAFGSDRPLFALLDHAYNDDKKRGNIVLKLPADLAPIQIGVFPLMNKLRDPAGKLFEDLKKSFVAQFDTSGSIGRRYARADETGIPYCITFDFDSEKNKDVTVRDRDSTRQVRVKIADLRAVLSDLIAGNKTFDKLK